MTLSSLDKIESLVVLEAIVPICCSQIYSLLPLGAALSLKKIVASQGGIFDVIDLAQSRTLVFLSLYRRLNLIVLHASSTTLISVVALQHCAALEVVDVCAWHSVGRSRATRIGAVLVWGGRHWMWCAPRIQAELLLTSCIYPNEVSPLGQCVNLRELSLTGTLANQSEGWAHARFASSCHQLLPPARECDGVAESSVLTVLEHEWWHRGPAIN
ncbi:hypothetical protein NXY56_005526 [Leishmania guyanensis]